MGLAWGLLCWVAPGTWLSSRLAEKKASIGYTYEDSTVAEVEKVAEKPEEEESPAEEESNSDEDEVIPDIGGVPSLPSPPAAPGHRFCVSPLALCGYPCLQGLPCPPELQDLTPLPPSLSYSQPPHFPVPSATHFWALFYKVFPPRRWLFLVHLGRPCFALGRESSPASVTHPPVPARPPSLPWKSPLRRLRLPPSPIPSSSWWASPQAELPSASVLPALSPPPALFSLFPALRSDSCTLLSLPSCAVGLG